MIQDQCLKTIEIICFRHGKNGFDILLQKEDTLKAYWYNFLSLPWQAPATAESAAKQVEEASQLSVLLKSVEAFPSLFWTYITQDMQHRLKKCPNQIMWVQCDVLLAKMIEKPQKFKPNLLKMVSACLKEVRGDCSIAV